MDDESSDETLLTGSAEDFGEFYRRLESAVLAYFLARTHDGEIAADLTSETFAQALASRKRYRAARAPARAWLFGIAAHVLARSLRKGRVEQRARQRLGIERISLDDNALDRVNELADADVVALALAGLPTSQQETVRARILADESYSDIARRLGCSESVARQRVSRGLKEMRATLEDQR